MNDSYLLEKVNGTASIVDFNTEGRRTTVVRYKCKWFNSGQNAFTGLRLVS